jgi:hypothetical protein
MQSIKVQTETENGNTKAVTALWLYGIRNAYKLDFVSCGYFAIGL